LLKMVVFLSETLQLEISMAIGRWMTGRPSFS
jgi:hypothetical protein